MSIHRILITALVIPLTLVSLSFSAEFGIGAKGGLNFSSLVGDDFDRGFENEINYEKKARVGFAGGVVVPIAFNDYFTFQPEILFMTKGVRTYEEGIEANVKWTETITTKNNYLDIPLSAKVTLPLKGAVVPHILVGAVPSFLLTAKVRTQRTEGDNETDRTISEYPISGGLFGTTYKQIRDNYNTFDFGLTFGGGAAIKLGPGHLLADIRYTLGLTDIRAYDENTSISESEKEANALKNRTFTIMFGYGIGL